MVSRLRHCSVQNWFSDFLHAHSDLGRSPAKIAAARPAPMPIMLHRVGSGRALHGD